MRKKIYRFLLSSLEKREREKERERKRDKKERKIERKKMKERAIFIFSFSIKRDIFFLSPLLAASFPSTSLFDHES